MAGGRNRSIGRTAGSASCRRITAPLAKRPVGKDAAMSPTGESGRDRRSPPAHPTGCPAASAASSSRATMLVIFIIGLTAGPAVSL